jgi:plastocyanin
MGVGRTAFLPVCALLGAAVAVLPAVAGSETAPTIEASSGYSNSWVPSMRTVGPGGVVAFSNSTGIPHGVEWRSAVTPSCSGVPLANSPEPSGTKWSGTCTFAQPGTYQFYCTVHHASMSGVVTVTGGETTPPPTTTGTTTTSVTTTQSGSTTTSTTPPPAASTAPLVSLTHGQRGRAVRGSVIVPAADAGGRLEVDLLASRASLAKTGAGSSVRVGRLVRFPLHTGRQSFTVALSARGKAALARRRRLALTVKLVLAPAQGSPSVAARAVVLRP